MTFEDLGFLVKKNIVLFSTITFGMFVLILLYALLIIQPVYDSSIQYNAIDEVQSVSSYKDFINDDSFQNDVRNQMVSDGYINRNRLDQLQSIKVTVTPGDTIFKVVASAKTPLFAQEYAMELNSLFQKRFARAFPNHHVTKVNGPSKPNSPSKPNLKRFTAYGFGVAVIISLVVVILKELMGKLIYSEFYVTKILGIESVGKIEYPKKRL